MSDYIMGKYTRGFGLSLIIMFVVNGLLVIVKESLPSLLNLMKAATGHHWITHGIIVVVLFFVLGFIFSGTKSDERPGLDAKRISIWLIVSAVIGFILVGGFYLID